MLSTNQSHVLRSLSDPSLAHNPCMYIKYISSPFQPYNTLSSSVFLSFPQPSQIPDMMPAVPSLSATELKNSLSLKNLSFLSNLRLIALGSPSLNNQSTDTFFLSDFSTRLITPPLTRYHLFLCLTLSLFPPPSALNPRPTVPRLTRYHLFLCLPLSLFPSTLCTHSTPHSYPHIPSSRNENQNNSWMASP